MLRRIAVCLAILCLTGPSLAQNNVQLAPRVPFPKTATNKIVLPEQGEIRLIVKFHDSLLVRATADGRVASLTNHDMSNVLALAAANGVKFRKAINHSLDKLATLENRAGALSKRGQPDLGGIMYVDGPEDVMLLVARALNNMPNVEYVEFEPEWIPDQAFQGNDSGGGPLAGGNPPACGDPNSTACDTVDDDNPYCNDVLCCQEVCGLDPSCCEDNWDQACVNLADAFCGDLPVLECGVDEALDCFVGHPLYYTACDDIDCCSTVCLILPDCCDVWWDDLCALVADNQCIQPPNPGCIDVEQGCFVEHVDPEEAGCNDIECCSSVCEFDAYCCNINWDFLCADEAGTVCKGGTPNLCGVEGTGDCEEANDNPYCDDADCCAIVCAMDPFCCETLDGEWDDLCVLLGEATCDDGATRQCAENALDCYQAHPPGGRFCDDPACCSEVCFVDAFCCNFVWDSICAGVALQLCRDADVCAANQFVAGPCLDAREFGGIGCSNEACCDTVCEIDPNCCSVEWDETCANIASSNCDFDSEDPTPDFTLLQGYRTIDWYFDEDGKNPPILHEGHSDGLPYPVPSFGGWTGEGFDLQGLWDFGEFILGLGNGEENLTRGKGARIGIVEHSAWVDHEDLINKVILEPGQTIIHMEGVVISSNHGTATLGIAVAEENGIGITGMAPEAQGYFFPIVSAEQGGRILSAMTAALLVFEHGDVLSYSIGPGGGTLDSAFTTNLMLRLSSDLGIISCISAGNSCINLDEDDTAGNALPDSGAITVGAGWPGFPFCRLGFSNHGDCGGRVHCQAWGTAVATTGYGTLFNPGAELPEAGDPKRQYANDFGGTSAAAPMIAAVAANIQGFAKMFYGIPLMPEQIRGVLSGSGFSQCGVACPALCGQIEIFNCFGDGDCDEDPNSIGFFPDPPTCAEVIMITPWFDGSPFIDDIEILRGTLVSGNAFSIKESDNNRLVIKSQFTNPGDNQGLGINYLATGQVTDLLVHAHIDDLTQPFDNLVITDERQQNNSIFFCSPAGVPPTSLTLNFFEMWNWTTQKWEFIIFEPAAIDDCDIPLFNKLVLGAARFVRPDDGKMQLRAWSLAIGGSYGGFGGGGTQPYFMRHDHINIQTTGFGGGTTPTPP